MKIRISGKRFLFLLLFIWYSLIFIGIPKLLPDERGDIFGFEGLLYLFLILILLSYLFKWKYSDFFALLIFLAWGYLQYTFHWKNLLGFKALQSDIDWYNRNFASTLRIFPASTSRIIPDAYHIILDLLLLLNLIVSVLNLYTFFKGDAHRAAKLEKTDI